ncbi:hypothetical protein GCM10023238_27540 [Streptomyces heliomycini]
MTVVIPKGSLGYAIGQELKKMGVVKSVDAFVAAQSANPQGKTIQDGVYTLQKEMSAASAVELMLSPKSRNNLIIAEGKRNADIYELIDDRLELEKGTTAKVAETEWKTLGLPDWAVNHEDVKDPLEGIPLPVQLRRVQGTEARGRPQTHGRAGHRDLRGTRRGGEAESLGLENPWQLVTVASLVQPRAPVTVTSARWRRSSTTASKPAILRPTACWSSTPRTTTSRTRARST